MARLVTIGYEIEAPGSGVAGPENPSGQATTGTLTRDTSNQRSGAACLACDATASGLAAYTPFSNPTLASRTHYLRAYIKVSALPASTVGVFGSSITSGVSARLTSGGKIQLWNNTGTPAQIGSDSVATLTSGVWYRLEFRFVYNSTSQLTDVELRLDGVTVATTSGLLLTGNAPYNVGWFVGPGASRVCYVDDVAFNDATGSANNSWCGDGKVVLLLPLAPDVADGPGWTNDGGGAASLCVTLRNRPPQGIADTTGGDGTHQSRNATSNANSSVDENLTTYTNAGVGASDTINAVQPWTCTAAPVSTSAKAGTVGIVSNPAITNVSLGAGGTAGAFWSGVAAGTYPTGWKWSPGTMTEAPTVTKGTSPVARITQVTASTRIAMVCFLGMYVDFSPAAAAARSLVVGGRRDLRSGSIPHLLIR